MSSTQGAGGAEWTRIMRFFWQWETHQKSVIKVGGAGLLQKKVFG